jgi:hypothetical protein
VSLIIDGYNLLHQTMPPILAGLDEDTLCRLLAVSRWRGERMTVVFDGKVKPHASAESPVAGVRMLWSGPRQTADAVIHRLIQRDSAPKRLLVVSSDHEIQRSARRRRARFQDSDRFVALLQQDAERYERSLKSPPSKDKPPVDAAPEAKQSLDPSQPKPAERPKSPGALKPDQVQKWLETFGIDEHGRPRP